MNLGRSARIPARLVEQAVLRQLAETMRARGLQVPNEMDLLNKARVTFRDQSGGSFSLADAIIAWEE